MPDKATKPAPTPIGRWQALMIQLNGVRASLHILLSEVLSENPRSWIDPLPVEIRDELIPFLKDAKDGVQGCVNYICMKMLEEHPDAEIPATVLLEELSEES